MTPTTATNPTVTTRPRMIGELACRKCCCRSIPPPSSVSAQRLLREAGFIEVEVTRRSGDGGIDGHGTIRLGGFISFNVLFQSKRYKGNIGPEIVRDFRGAMVGRADKGLIITTGGFTRDARREATRDGATPIDLIDGPALGREAQGVFAWGSTFGWWRAWKSVRTGQGAVAPMWIELPAGGRSGPASFEWLPSMRPLRRQARGYGHAWTPR